MLASIAYYSLLTMLAGVEHPRGRVHDPRRGVSAHGHDLGHGVSADAALPAAASRRRGGGGTGGEQGGGVVILHVSSCVCMFMCMCMLVVHTLTRVHAHDDGVGGAR